MCTTTTLYDWNIKKIFNNRPPFPNNTFRALIIGESDSGKTLLLNRMLLEPNLLDYNNLLIYASTSGQDIYQMLFHGFNNGLSKENIVNLYKNKQTFIDLDIEEICKQAGNAKREATKREAQPTSHTDKTTSVQLVNSSAELPPPKKLNKNKKNICVFDDCVTDQSQGVMGSYFTKGRHSNCNIFYLSQSLIHLDRNLIRGNANVFILFRRPLRELQDFYKDKCSTLMNQDAFIQTVTNYWGKDKHSYVFINKDDGIITNDIFNPNSFTDIDSD
jgi:hypothetical protein